MKLIDKVPILLLGGVLNWDDFYMVMSETMNDYWGIFLEMPTVYVRDGVYEEIRDGNN